ncbi:hypothetical protein ACFYZB_34095 [Streptomyces sp. NPDC001852]|uniref:hypothetical protein n=1 Tax=Streptomyces sp. NPDC001852 TaxID=3364619 RepID=UPI0036AB52F9
MSLQERKTHMAGDAAIYIKSRFAVCTGIQVTTVWMRNNGNPIGTSTFALYIRGTVKDNDRTIRYEPCSPRCSTPPPKKTGVQR